jgi:hypothetical protein
MLTFIAASMRSSRTQKARNSQDDLALEALFAKGRGGTGAGQACADNEK